MRRLPFGLIVFSIAGYALYTYWQKRTVEVPVFPTLKPPKSSPKSSFCGVSSKTLTLPKDHYSKAHRPAAQQLERSVHIKNKAQLDEMILNRELYTVIDGLGFKISREKLTHSYEVLHPTALTVLESLGTQFAAKLQGTAEEGSVFTISSLTRTHKQQQSLRRINKSATSSKSTHSYGASFDIWGIESPYGDCTKALPVLESLLKAFRKEKQLLLTPEFKCIHITVQ